MANSVDSDKMHFVASDLGLHCLQMPICPNTKGYYGMFYRENKKKISVLFSWFDLVWSFMARSILFKSCCASQLTHSHFSWAGLVFQVVNQYFRHTLLPLTQGLFWPRIFVREKIPLGQKQWEIFKFSEILFFARSDKLSEIFFFFFFFL